MDLQGYRFTATHEWVKEDGEHVLMGISDYAQKELGDVVFVELPSVGEPVEKAKQCATIESTKAASEIYAPASGKVVAVNEELVKNPQLVNQDPYGKGWMVRIALSDKKQLHDMLTFERYSATITH
jgi:glycine cleavage system H protein